MSKPEIRNYGVTVEEYLEGLAAGIDILELRRLESRGIPTDLALELMAITPKVVDGTATPEEIVRGLLIMSPSGREQLKSTNPTDCASCVSPDKDEKST